MRQKIQTYNDGVLYVHTVGNIAEPGYMPREGLTLKTGPLRYCERTVGMKRFEAAMQNQTRIDLLLRVPQRREVSTHDVAIPNDGHQYRVVRIQYPEDVVPPSMDLSLERIDDAYDLA